MKRLFFICLIGVTGIAGNMLALLIGWWLITLLVGFAIGLIVDKKGIAFLLAFCVGTLSWGLLLGIIAINAPVDRIALAVESIVGVSSLHGIAILLTIILGCLLSIVGWWVAITYRDVETLLGVRHLK